MQTIALYDNEVRISDDQIQQALRRMLDQQPKTLKKVLLLPPDITRLHSYAGPITRMLYEMLSPQAQVDIMPALGTHLEVQAHELKAMFGDCIPLDRFLVHDWRNDVVSLGQVPAEPVAQWLGERWEEPIDVQVNKRLLDPSYDAILSVGQVVPHEVLGMANYTKNICVGVGGSSMIGLTHMVGALYGCERMMGRDHTPVRRIFDYAQEHFLNRLPLTYIMTVIGEDEPRGLYIGDRRDAFELAVAHSQRINLVRLDKPVKKVVAFLDPEELHTVWVGNKAVHRTRMIIADGGELVILAQGVHQFGEDMENDALIRKYGYPSVRETLELMEQHADLKDNLAVASHLVMVSPDGRFKITYCTQSLTREEVEGAHMGYMPYQQAARRYDPSTLKDGFNTLPDGEEIYYVSSPAMGLWVLKEQFE